MSRKLPLGYFKWFEEISQCNEEFIKNCNEDTHESYILEFNVQNPENLHYFYNGLLFLPERMKIENVEKLVAILQDEGEYVSFRNQ